MQKNFPPSIADAVATFGFMPYQMAALGATTDLSEAPLGTVGAAAGVDVAGFYINPGPGTLTASDTLFRTITITKRTAGGSTVTIASCTTKTTGSGGTGSWVAWTPIWVPAASGATLAAGDSVSIAVTHASTGTAIPACTITLYPNVI